MRLVCLILLTLSRLVIELCSQDAPIKASTPKLKCTRSFQAGSLNELLETSQGAGHVGCEESKLV
jgi:hypothetical protein